MVRARKRFGQHFLEPAWVEKLIRAIEPTRTQTFLEIGAGRGALTRPLAASSHHVVACEIDRDLAGQLRGTLANVTVIEGDFLHLSADRLREVVEAVAAGTVLRLVGNLPYNVASPILLHLLELVAGGVRFVDATVMLQREVADRVTASPGSRDYGVLSILVGRVAASTRLFALPPGAFRPVPKVQSAVVRLEFPVSARVGDPHCFVPLVRAVFARRRKTLLNALKGFTAAADLPPAEALRRAQLDGRRRPETLTIPEFRRLAEAFDATSRTRLADKS